MSLSSLYIVETPTQRLNVVASSLAAIVEKYPTATSISKDHDAVVLREERMPFGTLRSASVERHAVSPTYGFSFSPEYRYRTTLVVESDDKIDISGLDLNGKHRVFVE